MPNSYFKNISPIRKSATGFTLIELLVTIAIIAIISVVAVALFGNIQRDARDGKRRAELESIANALEVNKSNTGGPYNPIDNTDFAGSVYPGSSTVEALDPQGYPYCIAVSTTVTPPTALPTNFSGVTGWNSGSTQCPTSPGTWAKLGGTTPANTTVSWTVCTRLENKGVVNSYCRSNTQ